MTDRSRDLTAIRHPMCGTRGMVATTEPLATAAGIEVLAASGNAADAAIATAAALAVVEPNNTGLGGDCFALYYDAQSGEVSALNGSGRAPSRLSIDRLVREGMGEQLPLDHAHTVTVPGACAGWFDLQKRHGTRPMDQLLAPAIRLAEEGFAVAPFNSRLWDIGVRTQLGRSPGGRELMIDGRAPRAGELFRNPAMARSLRSIATKGRDVFYAGEIGQKIVSTVQEFGGALEMDDLEAHESTWEEPLSIEYRGLRVWECPPNGQGIASLMALGLLSNLELADQDPLGPERFHLMIEVMRLAFADARWYVADPALTPVPTAELLSEAYAQERLSKLDPARASLDFEKGSPVAGSDTVYFCCVDAAGNACSFINSNYMAFGTGIVPEGTGFSLQNRGYGFSLDPAHPNALAPGKRPYHTIIPGLITREVDGSLWGPFGVMGGYMQPQGHMQVVVALADDGLDPQAALDRPRFNIVDGTAGGGVNLEPGVPEATQRRLAEMGHPIQQSEGLGQVLFGRGQVIRRESDGVLWGGTDPRADGCVMVV
ncbi:MAG: gamma-glutamyltransferase family protein [Deltaproteobacteria bacterium]|nr:gamma-glutamyltransferase family protein [Deltaproteobacteria bacterium]